MRKIALSTLVIASLGLSSAAMAAATTVTGPVAAVDAKTETVSIGKTAYVFPAKFDLSKVKVGDKVTITFEVKAGTNDATKIEAAK